MKALQAVRASLTPKWTLMLRRFPAVLAFLIFSLFCPLETWPQTTPQILNVSPNSGFAGNLVTITGSGFGISPGAGSVAIGGASASINTWTDNQITAFVGMAAQTGAGNVLVTNGAGSQSNAFNFTVLPPSVFTGPVSYSYDELGRLVGVVAATGDSARYTYDAVGNILSIARYTSNQVSLFTFHPKAGPAGTQVTIAGSNFSLVPTQNAVAFNGAAATVITASATQLVVAVPAGAVTGPITVTSPAGTVTSADAFTLTTFGEVPSITSFTPAIVAPGTTVAVSGSNFDPNSQNDRLMVNMTRVAQPTAVTTSLLNLIAPALTGSGHLSLSTPGGSTTSTGDLFIPPSPFTVAQVAYTGRTTPGTATTVSISTANKLGMLLFEGVAGQTVSIASTSASFSACVFQLYKPDNTSIGGQRSCVTSDFLDALQLPVSGTYTVLLNASNGSAGSVVLTVYQFPGDVNGGDVAVGGQAVTAQNSFPGQNMRFTFNGAVNQHVSLSLVSSTFNTCNLSIYEPPSTLLPGALGMLLASSIGCSSSNTFSDVPLLPVSGRYTVVVDPNSRETGTVIFKLVDSTDVIAPITPGGPPVTATTTNPGQNIRLTFNGTTGQVVSAAFTNDTYPHGINVSLLDPTGATIRNTSSSGVANNAFLDAAHYCGSYPCSQVTLPSNGIYTLFLDPTGADVGSIQTTLYNVPADQSAAVTLGGAPAVIALNTPGQNARITFAGTQNHKLGFSMAGATFTGTISQGCSITVVSPAGAVITTGQNCYSASAFFDSWVLPLTGTYTLAVDPLGNTTGGANLQFYDNTDISFTIAPDGTSYNITTTVPGQNALLTFTGTSGQRIFGVVDNIAGYTGLNFLFAQFLRNGSVLSYGQQDGPTFDICSGSCAVQALPANDTYSIFLNPNGTDVGSARVRVFTVPPDFSGSIGTSGTPVVVTTGTPGQNAQLTFTANSGQTLTSLSLSSGTYPSSHCTMSMKRPDGQLLASGLDCSGGAHTFGPYSLTQTGTYTILLDPQFAATGGVTVAVNAN